jgi:hypothetical protein
MDRRMKQQFRLYRRRNGVFYLQHNETGKQESLKTSDRREAERLSHARNEAHIQPQINRQIAQAYLAACDPKSKTRTWEHVMDALTDTKKGENKDRYQTAMKDAAFDVIRHVVVVETRPEELLKCLQADGQKVSTNYYSRHDGNERLRRNRGIVASFSRALVEGLSAQQSDVEFNASLDSAIASIFEASTSKEEG